MKKLSTLLAATLVLFLYGRGQSIRFDNALFSTAGFHKLENADCRRVYSFNNGWYFHKGDIPSASAVSYKRGNGWRQVQLPHGIDLLPEEASGGVNYQGIVWYRKRFTVPKECMGKRIVLTFEAIMGKCRIWLNGALIAEHKGGYLPIVLDLTKHNLINGGDNVIAVCADNSDDGLYPPGKPEYSLDFTYMGGIYRDAWLVAMNDVHLTEPNEAHTPAAGGGVLVHYENVSQRSADVLVQTEVQNESPDGFRGLLETFLQDSAGNIVASTTADLSISTKISKTITRQLHLSFPRLWSPDEPNLYRLYSLVKNVDNEILDGYYQNIGIRSIELHGDSGLYLNGKPFQDKLVGANHHQDYAVIGNAVPNNLQWEDAKLMRDAGIRIIRGSHYPQDPAFMDACDRVGIFVIDCIPGWQYWNNDPSFVHHMYDDIRQMIRRDRNHPSVFAWESVPNETGYAKEYARAFYTITHAEYPYSDCIAAANSGSALADTFDLVYAHPNEFAALEHNLGDSSIANGDAGRHIKQILQKPFFTREWGDNVDNWNAQNSDSRTARTWGEVPQLVQALHFSDPDSATRLSLYGTSWETIYESPPGYIGGALWHFFDTQRGYYPDPFYGGLVDAFRQTKYSYYLFKSQQNPSSPYFSMTQENPYTLFIANELTPFSPSDIPVFTNCDSVELTVYGKYSITRGPETGMKMPHPPIIFRNIYHFSDVQKDDLTQAEIVAKGFKGGRVVIVTKKIPGSRPAALKLSTNTEAAEMLADGGTIIPVTVSMLDDLGHTKRLTDQWVSFSVRGEGRLVGDPSSLENPKQLGWGTAVILVRPGLRPGRITIIARPFLAGSNTVKGDTLVLHTIPSPWPSVYNPADVNDLERYDTPLDTQTPYAPAMDETKKKEQLNQVKEAQRKFQTNKLNP